MMSGEGRIAFKQTKDPFAQFAQGPLKAKTRRSSQETPQAAIGIGAAADASRSEGTDAQCFSYALLLLWSISNALIHEVACT